MLHCIKHPEYLNILDGETVWFGGEQEWYSSYIRRLSGCGPTCATNLAAYLARRDAALAPLYPYADQTLPNFLACMDVLFTFATPRQGGLNKPEDFVSGVERYAERRGLSLRSHLLPTAGNRIRERESTAEVAAFVANGLEHDCPVAFLNLSNGRERKLQGWHWITIVSLDEESFLAEASDEGKKITFDFKKWYLTTRMRGGFAWFEANGC